MQANVNVPPVEGEQGPVPHAWRESQGCPRWGDLARSVRGVCRAGGWGQSVLCVPPCPAFPAGPRADGSAATSTCSRPVSAVTGPLVLVIGPGGCSPSCHPPPSPARAPEGPGTGPCRVPPLRRPPHPGSRPAAGCGSFAGSGASSPPARRAPAGGAASGSPRAGPSPPPLGSSGPPAAGRHGPSAPSSSVPTAPPPCPHQPLAASPGADSSANRSLSRSQGRADPVRPSVHS